YRSIVIFQIKVVKSAEIGGNDFRLSILIGPETQCQATAGADADIAEIRPGEVGIRTHSDISRCRRCRQPGSIRKLLADSIRSEGIRWKDKTVKACRARVVRVGDAIGTIAVNSPSLNSNFSSALCSIQVRVVELGTRDGRKVWVAGQRTQRTRAIREFDLEIIGLAFGRHKS